MKKKLVPAFLFVLVVVTLACGSVTYSTVTPTSNVSPAPIQTQTWNQIAMTQTAVIYSKYLQDEAPDELIFEGIVVNTTAQERLNDRLVLLFLGPKEIARSTTYTGKDDISFYFNVGHYFSGDTGITDGFFSITVPNTYKLSLDGMGIPSNEQLFVMGQKADFLKSIILGTWIDSFSEGETRDFYIPSKKIHYTLVVLKTPISLLPAEIQQPGSARLRGDGKIIAAPPDSATSTGYQINDVIIQDIKYATKIEKIETNKITVPINNCGGSVQVSQTYTQAQTFIHQYSGEIGLNIGMDIPLKTWAKLTPEFQAKYGFENGQVDTRTVEYNMAAAPGTNVVYIVKWSEVWESGAANVTSGNDTIVVPFRVKTNLIYDITSESRSCP